MTKCPVCHYDRIKTVVDHRLSECKSCRLVFQTELSNISDLINTYRNDKVETDHIPDVYAKSRFSLFLFFIKLISRLTDERNNIAPKKKLLDVGCGYGTFLDIARKFGWVVEGVEISGQAVKWAEERLGLKIFTQSLPKLNLVAGSYDVVTFLSVLSVVGDPLQQIEEAERCLKSGGIVFLRVENSVFHLLAFRVSKLFKFSNFGILPYVFHQNNFNRNSLAALLQMSGFEDVNVINSPLTHGDPYRGGGILGDFGSQIVKIIVTFVAWLVAKLSLGKCLVSPSLIAWGRKPL